MKRKVLVIGIILIVLLAAGTVFAQQVCLSKSVACVNVSGTLVTVRNSMQDQPINVEVYYFNTRLSNGNRIDDGSKQTLYLDNIPAMGSKSGNLPANARYDDYEVFSCR